MDAVDHAVLTFAVRWLPYGAPLDDVFVEFGLTPAQYVQRVCDLVVRHRSRIHPETVDRLLAVGEAGRQLVQSTMWVASASGA